MVRIIDLKGLVRETLTWNERKQSSVHTPGREEEHPKSMSVDRVSNQSIARRLICLL